MTAACVQYRERATAAASGLSPASPEQDHPKPSVEDPAAAAGVDERAMFEAWADTDSRDLTPEDGEDAADSNGLYYRCDSTNHAFIGWRQARRLAPPAAAAWEAQADRLHQQIMNLTCDPTNFPIENWVAFKQGHKQARHAAAELVMVALSASPTQAPKV